MKVALIVGINYIGTPSALRGCINDAKNVRRLLLERGFKKEHIVLLTDKTEEKPTRARILHHLNSMMQSGADTMVFHYSGHGSSVRDHSGDEKDGKDETLCPLDYRRAGFIIDDDIRKVLCKAPPTAKIFCVLDCCHSGSGCDLGYNIVKRREKFIMARDNHYPDTPAQIVLLSGCRDFQTSADAYLKGQAQGALTAMFLVSMRFDGVKTWEQLYTSTRRHIHKCRFRQIPNLTSGRPLNPKEPMFI